MILSEDDRKRLDAVLAEVDENIRLANMRRIAQERIEARKSYWHAIDVREAVRKRIRKANGIRKETP